MRTFWTALGISADDIIVPAVPTKIEQLVIPHPAFVEQNTIYSVYSDLCRTVGDRIIQKEANPYYRSKKIYIRKSRLSIGVSRIINEELAEEVARSMGFNIVYSESLMFSEQIQIFRVAESIVGFASSAFHLSAFSAGKSTNIVFTPNRFVNSNFKLIDLAGKVSPTQARYLNLGDDISEEGEGDGFLMNYKLKNVDAIKNTLAALS